MKKAEQQVTQTLEVTPKSVWKVIGSGTDVHKWFPEMIKTCELDGNRRICGTDQGSIIEEILKVDHENMEFKYAFVEQNMIPGIQNIIGNMRVMSNEEGKAVINWRWSFEAPNEEVITQAKEALKGAGNLGLRGLEAYIQGN